MAGQVSLMYVSARAISEAWRLPHAMHDAPQIGHRYYFFPIDINVVKQSNIYESFSQIFCVSSLEKHFHIQ